MDDLDCSALPADGDLVLTVPYALTVAQAEGLRAHLDRELPGRKVLVLGNGMRLGRIGDSEQLDRIERKLDTLIKALADDDDDEPQYTLDGDPMPGEREEGAPL